MHYYAMPSSADQSSRMDFRSTKILIKAVLDYPLDTAGKYLRAPKLLSLHRLMQPGQECGRRKGHQVLGWALGKMFFCLPQLPVCGAWVRLLLPWPVEPNWNAIWHWGSCHAPGRGAAPWPQASPPAPLPLGAERCRGYPPTYPAR